MLHCCVASNNAVYAEAHGFAGKTWSFLCSALGICKIGLWAAFATCPLHKPQKQAAVAEAGQDV